MLFPDYKYKFITKRLWNSKGSANYKTFLKIKESPNFQFKLSLLV
jgi:hypothetical protein